MSKWRVVGPFPIQLIERPGLITLYGHRHFQV